MNEKEKEELKELLVHPIKELGEIAECVVKGDKDDHWTYELCDLCAFGIYPMLEMAELDFEDAIEIGENRKYEKMNKIKN